MRKKANLKKSFLVKSFIFACAAVSLLRTTPISAEPRAVSIEAVFGKTKFTLNGEHLEMDSLLYDGAAYLPAAYIVRELGLLTRWDPEENCTYITYSFSAPQIQEITGDLRAEPETVVIDAVFGSTRYFLNGRELEQECLVYDGTAYLPAGYLARELGLSTRWDPETNITNIVYIPVEGVSFETAEVVMNRYSTVTLNPEIYPPDASIKTLKYESDNEEAVSVGENGELYANAEGTAVITCTSVNGVRTSVRVRSIVPVTAISVRAERYTYQVGETAGLMVAIYPEDATDKSFTLTVDNGASIRGNYAVLQSSGKVIISVAASNGVSDSIEIRAVDLNEFAAEVLRLTNVEREKVGLRPLSGSYTQLNDCAMLRAREIIQVFTHDRPDGRSCFTAFEESGVKYFAAGENIAHGHVDPEDVMDGWMNSPGHKENILDFDFLQMGVGVAMNSTGELFWTQSFTN